MKKLTFYKYRRLTSRKISSFKNLERLFKLSEELLFSFKPSL